MQPLRGETDLVTHQRKRRHGGGVDFEINANWKPAGENNADFYHLPAVNPGLNSYSDHGDLNFFNEHDTFFGTAAAKYVPETTGGFRLPIFPGPDPALQLNGEYPLAFPTFITS